MKQVVLSLSDESESRLRRLAQRTKQGRKGALSATVEDALLLLETSISQKEAFARLLELASKDRSFGVGKFDREEAYR